MYMYIYNVYNICCTVETERQLVKRHIYIHIYTYIYIMYIYIYI